MKTSIILICLLATMINGAEAAVPAAAAITSVSNRADSASYKIVKRDADSRVWERTTLRLDASGQATPHVERYTELASGMHYKKSGQWVESSEAIDVLPEGGASATHGRHQVYFPSDVYDGVLELVTTDGKHLQSRPIGVSYDDGKQSAWVAILKHSTGVLISSNKIMYPDAFNGFKADLVCTYRRHGFECDLVVRENPPSPVAYGLEPNVSRLQLVTEFFNTVDPQKVPAAENSDFGLTDDTLKFGNLSMIRGKAFIVNSEARKNSAGIPVYKDWVHLQDRQFLMEQVPLKYLARSFSQLPKSTNILSSQVIQGFSPRFASNARTFPPVRTIVSDTNRILAASIDLTQRPGVVLDYNTVNSDQGDYTFEANTTYFVNGGFSISGTATFEAGAVIKFSDSLDSGTYYYNRLDGTGNPVMAMNQISCQADIAHPVILTSMDDDAVGSTIFSSSGTPGTLDVPFLGFNEDSSMFANLRFRYAGVGVIETDFTAPTFVNCEFMNCDIGVGGYGNWPLVFQNCAFGSGTGIEDPEYGDAITLQNVTMANSSYNLDIPEIDSSLQFSYPGPFSILNVTNSLFSGGQSLSGFESSLIAAGGTVNDSCSADLVGSFQNGPAGSYYLSSGSIHINAGNTTADLIGLYHFTTQTNQTLEGNSQVDLGYHYLALDAFGNPLDSNGNGTPDYIEDANANGIWDVGIEPTDWKAAGPDTLGTVGFQVYTPLK